MVLIIFRHGPAGDRLAYQENGGIDSERPLTPEGKNKTQDAAKGLSHLIKEDFLILSSPYVRAKQTAETLHRVSDCKKPINYSESLIGNRHPSEFCDVARKIGAPVIVAVGHEPHLSSLASHIVYGDSMPYKIKIKKAGALALRWGISQEEETEFLWLMTPKQLARL